jgi:hypothetical protein
MAEEGESRGRSQEQRGGSNLRPVMLVVVGKEGCWEKVSGDRAGGVDASSC